MLFNTPHMICYCFYVFNIGKYNKKSSTQCAYLKKYASQTKSRIFFIFIKLLLFFFHYYNQHHNNDAVSASIIF